MIIKAFSDYIKQYNTEIPCIILLGKWLKSKLSKPPESNVDRVIHHEISYVTDKNGVFLLVGNTPSGKILLESLYNFALSYEQQNFNRWLHNVKPDDFKEK